MRNVAAVLTVIAWAVSSGIAPEVRAEPPPAAAANPPTTPAPTTESATAPTDATTGAPPPPATDAAPSSGRGETSDSPSVATPAPADAATAVAPATPRRGLLLPIEFTVYQAGVGGRLETIPEWTTAAREHLRAAALATARSRAGIELVEMPPLSVEQRATLDEYAALARLIVANANTLSGKAWNARKDAIDLQLGDGLAFLHEQTGAEFAVLIDGMQVKQSGGSIFMQLALAGLGIIAPGGGGTSVIATVIDLKDGHVEWFNTAVGIESLGIARKDVRDIEGTQKVLADLFAPYPRIPALTAK